MREFDKFNVYHVCDWFYFEWICLVCI